MQISEHLYNVSVDWSTIHVAIYGWLVEWRDWWRGDGVKGRLWLMTWLPWHVAWREWLKVTRVCDVALWRGCLQPLIFRRQLAAPSRWLGNFPATLVAARGGSVGHETLVPKVFGPSGRDGGVSFSKKWPESGVSGRTTLLLTKNTQVSVDFLTQTQLRDLGTCSDAKYDSGTRERTSLTQTLNFS